MNDTLKKQIRRRVHEACLADGKTSPFAALFPECLACHGSGRFSQCYEINGDWFSERGPCPQCDGAGFTENTDKMADKHGSYPE